MSEGPVNGAIRANVCAVVVTYNPEFEILAALIDATKLQVTKLIIVDNASETNLRAWLGTKGANVELVVLEKNQGIGEAQNKGILRARELGAEYVILFDHDSIPTRKMVAKQLAVLKEREATGEKIAAIGPRIFDPRRPVATRLSSFLRIDGVSLRRVYPEIDTSLVRVSHLNASGSLIPMRVLDIVGLMNPDLFIDYVDIEWSLRALAQGYQSYGLWDALMEHRQGEEPIRLWREFVCHSPIRHYYAFRNAVWLCRQKWMRPCWRAAFGWNTVQRFCLYMFFAPKRLERLRFIGKGLSDGLQNRMGAGYLDRLTWGSGEL